MQIFKNRIAFVIATKDRPEELHRMLKSLEAQSYYPEEIIIVDGGKKILTDIIDDFQSLPIRYLRCFPPSATKQRNMGIKEVNSDVSLVGFFDDDIELEPKAIEAMMEFWEDASGKIAGTGFNMINHPSLYASRLKSLPLTEWLGLYSKVKGKIVPSGFHTMIGFVSKPTLVQWLPTTAVVWRKEIFNEFKFDEWFSGYSYLEDLDFSFRVGKKYQFIVVDNAQYYHHHAPYGRGNDYRFGVREVVNRVYFVKKYRELSLFKCYLALFERIFINLSLALKERRVGYFLQTCGNIMGIGKQIFKGI